jgi:hypothetical protein
MNISLRGFGNNGIGAGAVGEADAEEGGDSAILEEKWGERSCQDTRNQLEETCCLEPECCARRIHKFNERLVIGHLFFLLNLIFMWHLII